MNGRVNPSSGGGEPTDERHRDEGGDVRAVGAPPPAVRACTTAAIAAYHQLRAAGQPLTLAQLAAGLNQTERHLRNVTDELETVGAIASVYDSDGTGRKLYFPTPSDDEP